MLDHIFLELIIGSNWKMQFQSKWNLELSISINEIHLKINTICQIIKKQFSKASVKGRGKKWTLWIINAHVIFPLTVFPQKFRHCMYTNLLMNGSRIKLRFGHYLLLIDTHRRAFICSSFLRNTEVSSPSERISNLFDFQYFYAKINLF